MDGFERSPYNRRKPRRCGPLWIEKVRCADVTGCGRTGDQDHAQSQPSKFYDVARCCPIGDGVVAYGHGYGSFKRSERTGRQWSGIFEAQVCYIVHQALLGLQHVHERGFAHRDVKPVNLLLARDGTVKLSDFGVSEFLPNFPADEIVTRTVGTPVFHAPEIARGDDAFYRTKLDGWALGATTCMLLSGRPRFRFTGCVILPLYQHILSEEYKEIDEVSSVCRKVI